MTSRPLAAPIEAGCWISPAGCRLLLTRLQAAERLEGQRRRRDGLRPAPDNPLSQVVAQLQVAARLVLPEPVHTADTVADTRSPRESGGCGHGDTTNRACSAQSPPSLKAAALEAVGTQEASQMLGCSARTVRRYVGAGLLTDLRLSGAHIWLASAEVAALAAQRRTDQEDRHG